MRLGLIAGNGRFPFLVLEAARSLGHEVTIIAVKEEADADLEQAAAAVPGATVHRVSLGHLGKCIALLQRYESLQARDIVHVATCLENRIDTIVSTDEGFDQVSEIRRLAPDDRRLYRRRK